VQYLHVYPFCLSQPSRVALPKWRSGPSSCFSASRCGSWMVSRRCGEMRDGALLLLCDTHAPFSLHLLFILLRYPRLLGIRSSSSYSQHPGVHRQGPAVWGEVGSPSISSRVLSNMLPSSAQLLGQSTIRSLRANVVGIRTRPCAAVPMGCDGLRGICLSSHFCPVKGPVGECNTVYGDTRSCPRSGAPRAQHKKSPRPRRL
jgi:hypothetical protein